MENLEKRTLMIKFSRLI